MFMGRYYFIINKFLQLSSTFQINILAQQVPSRARKEPHKISEEGGGRSGHSAEKASLPSRLQTYFGLPRVRSTAALQSSSLQHTNSTNDTSHIVSCLKYCKLKKFHADTQKPCPSQDFFPSPSTLK